MFYLRPHDGTLAIGPFTLVEEAETFYQTNLAGTGCDIVQAVDPTGWPAEGNALVSRFEVQDPAVSINVMRQP